MIFDSIALGKRYLTHWLNTVDEHSLQAPFIYNFYTKAVKNQQLVPKVAEILELKRTLSSDKRKLEVTDLGTGSGRSTSRTISEIATKSNSNRVSRLLYNLSREYKPKTVLELGTSLGFSTFHMAAANPNTRILTIEGCPAIAAQARANADQLDINNIEVLHGEIGSMLSSVLSGMEQIDLLFVDANHQYEATVNYVNQCLPKLSTDSIIVLDDIHWSASMEAAWENIRNYPEARVTVDLFYTGVIFLNNQLSNSHYVLTI